MPTFHVEMFEGRSIEQKRAFVKAVTEAAVATIGARRSLSTSSLLTSSPRTGPPPARCGRIRVPSQSEGAGGLPQGRHR